MTRPLYLVALLLATICALWARDVFAEDRNEALTAAQACFVEATWRESDCVALLWVARKRAERKGVPWVEMIVRYSAITADNPRAREVRGYADGDVSGKSAAWNRRWARLRELAAAVIRGDVADPCPRASHWGSRNIASDVERADRAIREGRWMPARCVTETRNAFYEVKDR